MYKFSKQTGNLPAGMWQTCHTPRNADPNHEMEGTGQWARMLKGQLFGPGGQYHSRVIGSMGDTRAASKAPQRKRPCRSRATARRSLLRHAFQPALKSSQPGSIAHIR